MRAVLIVLILLAAATRAEAQRAGERVVLTQPAELWVADETVGSVPRGTTLLVLQARAGWYWVEHGKRGWIDGARAVRLGEAERRFSEAVERDPSDVVAWNTRANLRLGQDRFAEAIHDYDQVVRLQPEVARVYNNRGTAWSKQHEYDRAIADFDRAIQLDGEYGIAYYNRGRAWYQKQQLDRAIDDYTRAIELEPKHPWGYNNRGLAWYAKGDYAKAIADYDRALQLDPDLYRVRNNRGWALFRSERRDEAFSDFNEVVRQQLAEDKAGPPVRPAEHLTAVEPGPLPSHVEARAQRGDVFAFNIPMPGIRLPLLGSNQERDAAKADAEQPAAMPPRQLAAGEGMLRFRAPWAKGSKPLMLQGIYQLQRDTLTLYGLEKGSPRPASFETHLGDGGVLVVLKRSGGFENYDRDHSDRENILGSWRVVAAQRDGKPTVRLNDNELTFSKEQILLTTPSGKTFRFRYRLDLSRQPRQYDLKLEFAGGPAGDERTKQLEALARRYQSSFPQGPQPVDFRATVGNGRFLGLAVSLLTLLAIVGNYLGRFVGPQALQVADGVLGNPTGTPQRAHLLLAALLLAGLGACAPLGGMQFHPQSFDVALQRFASLAFAKSSFGSPSAWVGDMLLLVPVAFLWTGVFAVDLPRRRARWAIAVQIVLLGAALRVLFEFFQFWFNPTNISQYDILPETIGLVLGAGLWLFTGQPLVDWTRSMTVSQRPMSKLDWALLCYLAAFIIYAVLPIEITVRGADLARKYRDGLVIMQPFSEPLWPLGVLVNTFLFIPVGVLTSRLWTTTVRPIRAGENAIAWGMALVALVELGQLLVVERFTSTTDLFSGTLGVVLGVLATSRWRRSSALDALLAPSSGYLRRVAPYLIVAAVYAGLVFVASCMPFRPIHDPDQLATRYTNIFQQPFAVMHHAALDQVLVQALWHMLFFVPLGMLLGRAVIAPSIPAPVRGVLLSLALLFVAAVALAIEVVQVYLPPHVPGMLDVVACTAGAALGIVGMTLFSLARARQPA